MPFDDYKLSDEEHNQVLAEIRDFVFQDKTPVAHPQVYILGGQPGAGKSVLTESVMKSLADDNIISINGDEFRLWHPKAAEEYISDLKELRQSVLSQNDAQEKREEMMGHFKSMSQSVRKMKKPYTKPETKEISGYRAQEILSFLQGSEK